MALILITREVEEP